MFSYEAYLASKRTLAERHRSDPSTIDKFIYPNHPFPAKLCLKISKMPAGFRELCLSRILSTPLIEIAERIGLWADARRAADSQTEPQKSALDKSNFTHGARCIELLKNPAATINEQLVAVALLAYCMFMDRSKQVFFLLNAYLQIHSSFLANNICACPRYKWYPWVGMMLAATFDDGSQMWQLATKLLGPKGNSNQRTEDEQLCEAYLWSDDLSSSLAGKTDLRCPRC